LQSSRKRRANVSNASVKIGLVKGREKLSVMSTDVVIYGKGEDRSTERSTVHDEE